MNSQSPPRRILRGAEPGRLTRAGADAGEADAVRGGGANHAVQFYVDDAFLIERVARFLGRALGAGEPAIVIATAEHQAAVERRLGDNGLDVQRARATGQLAVLDARATLACFMVAGMPDWEKFRTTIGAVIDRCRELRPDAGLSAYGEMVDLLWREGNREGAIRLEELWNQLGRERTFSLLCAYGMENFQEQADRGPFEAVCGTHSDVIPTERYWGIESPDGRLREITLLQQRAEALESEIRRRAAVEEELRASQRHLRDFAENAVVALHWVGPDGKVLWANAAELEMLGYTRDEYVGHHIAEFHADASAIRDILERLGRNETLHDHEAKLRCKDGTIKEVVISSNVLREGGKFVHTRCFTRDVTARRQAERQLRESEQARARLLAREQEARAAAEAASRAKDDFLAMLGHELRNPLAPILTAVELMRLRGAGAAEKELETIERQGRHLVRLVDDLLDVARITRGRVELERERVDLADIVARAVETTRPLIEQRRHRLELSVPRGLAVDGDRTRLVQIVANLLSNAAKYTTPGGTVSVTARGEPAEIVLAVRDDGVGIAPDVLPRVFDLFAQGEQSIDRASGGLGLGLAIVRTLVTLHGGTVSAASAGHGRGSEFTVRLPRAAAHEWRGTEAGAATTRERTGNGHRILLVDDNQDAVDLLGEALSMLGYTVRTATDGPRALEVAAEFAPTVAFLDIGLPGMDGYDVAQHLRRSPALAGTRLVAVTGYGQDSDRARTREAGFDAHLVKPVNLDGLAALLESFPR